MLFESYPTVKLFSMLFLTSLVTYNLLIGVMDSRSANSDSETAMGFPKEIIDYSVDPCKDFYNFTCANFGASKTIQQRITAIGDDLDYLLSTDKDDDDDDTSSSSYRNAQLLYRYCVSPSGDPPRAHSWLKEFLPRWQYEFSWVEMVLGAREAGIKYDFFMDVSAVFQYENKEWTLKVSVPRSTAHIWKKNNRDKINTLLHYWRPVYMNSMEEVDKLIEFGVKLNKLFDESTYPTPDDALRRPISELPRMESIEPTSYTWVSFLRNVTKLYSLTENEFVTYDFNEKNNVTYFERLERLMESYQQRTWLDYISIVIMEDLCPFLGQASPIGRACNFRGETAQMACRNIVTQDLRMVIEAEYLRTFVPKEARELVSDMFNAINGQLKQVIKDSTRLVHQKKGSRATEMLDDMTVLVGGGDILYDRETFEEYYGYKTNFIDASDGFEYHRRLSALSKDRIFRHYDEQRVSSYFQKDKSGQEFVTKTFKRLYDEKDPRDAINPFSYSSLTLPVTYSSAQRKLILPASILRWPVFSVDQPLYMNYAGLGSVIGEKLVDTIYDVIKSEWFVKSYHVGYDDRIIFNDESHCLEKLVQFYSYNLNLPSWTTLSKRQLVSAFIGVQLAYDAFRERHDIWPLEPNTKDYQPIQLFWIWSRIRYCLSGDRNAPYQVIVPVANSRDFQEDFQCDDHPMNPLSKCRILI